MTTSTTAPPDTPTPDALDAHLAQFQKRVIQDAMQQASRVYWLHRAEQFEWAKPRLDDHHGQVARADLSAAWNRCDAAARACRAKADMALVESVPELSVVLSEVAA